MFEERLAELEEWVWSLWDQQDIKHEEFIKVENELSQIYTETNDYQCLWILSEMYETDLRN